MMVVPPWMWRGGPARRAITLGLVAGILLGAFAFADSGLLLGALVAFVVLAPFYGILMARRMARFWPGAKDLNGADRVAVARAARRGEDIGETRLAHAVFDYSAGLREACRHARRYWWVVLLFGVVAVIFAVIDTIFGPVRVAVLSWLVVVFFAVELLWWPRRQARLLANAERAEDLARRVSRGGS